MKPTMASPVYWLVALLLFGYTASAEPVPVKESWSGDDSRVTERSCFQLTAETAWNEIWQQHAKDVHQPAPIVDFNANIVLALFDGQTINSRGIFASQPEGQPYDGKTFYVMPSGYQTAGFGERGGAVDVTPYGIFVLPRQSKYRVMEGTPNLAGAPIPWNERECIIK